MAGQHSSTEYNFYDEIQSNDKIKKVDSDDSLDIYSYISCNNNDCELVRKCRGVVMDGCDVIVKGNYTLEYTDSDYSDIKDLDISNLRFFDSHEGTLIRVFFHDKWYISTHRKLDAFRSRWSSKTTFGNMFANAIHVHYVKNNITIPEDGDVLRHFLDSLDKGKQYTFFVRNIETNRIVCDVPEYPTVYHIGTYIDDHLNIDDDVCGIPRPREHRFANIDALVNFIRDCCHPFQFQGIIAFDDTQSVFKMVHSEYKRLFDIRGNQPSIKFRYLQVRNDDQLRSELYKLYPSCIEILDSCERIIGDIINNIYNSYVNRYIKKQHVRVPPEEFAIMKQCHNWHCEDRGRNRISYNKIRELVDNTDPKDLNTMIKRINERRYNNYIKPIQY